MAKEPSEAGMLRRRRRGVAAAFVAAAGLVAIFLVNAGLMASKSPVAGIHQERGRFYRFTARYTVITTGEELNFDVVVPCQRMVTEWKSGERTIDPAVYPNDSPYPFLFPKVTRDHNAVLVGVPDACDHFNRDGTIRGIPEDLLPRVTWFENADRLDFGLMYASPDAYNSPLAKLKFHFARIEPSSHAEYAAWMDHLKKTFTPTKNIIFPFGFTIGQFAITASYRLGFREDGSRWLPHECLGLAKYRIDDQELREYLRNVRPDSAEFWSPLHVGIEVSEKISGMLGRDKVVEGRSLRSYWKDSRFLRAVPTYGGGGTLSGTKVFPSTVYPLVRYDFGEPWIKENFNNEPMYMDFSSDRLIGFLGCQSYAQNPKFFKFPVGNKGIAFRAFGRLDGKIVWKNESLWPLKVFERDEYVYFMMRAQLSGE